MPPCWLAQSLGEVCKLESMCEGTARIADLRRHPPCRIPKLSIQLTGFAIDVDPKSNMELGSCPLWVKSEHFAVQSPCPLYPQSCQVAAPHPRRTARCHSCPEFRPR